MAYHGHFKMTKHINESSLEDTSLDNILSKHDQKIGNILSKNDEKIGNIFVYDGSKWVIKNIQSMLNKMGMGNLGGLGGGGKVNTAAMEANLNQKMKMAQTKERMRAKAEANADSEAEAERKQIKRVQYVGRGKFKRQRQWEIQRLEQRRVRRQTQSDRRK